MTVINDGLLSEEDLDNTDNDNQGDNNVDENSSGNEQMKKVLKIRQKRG